MNNQDKKNSNNSFLKNNKILLRRCAISIGALLFFFIFVTMLPRPYYKTGFRNLSELREYAKTIDEWIEMENDNAFFPNYDGYYKRRFTRTFWRDWKSKFAWLLNKFYLIRQPLFSSSFFKEILEDVTKYRLDQDWRGDIVQKIEVNKNSKVIVFGVVQGAFHSLIRCLTKLNELGILDKNLKLQDPNYSIAFLGNVVNRSPYTLETFSVVLRLLQENPEKAIYLRGTNEYFDYWKDHTLRRELELRCTDLSNMEIPLSKEVNEFFNTLPLTLYCTMPHLSNDEEINYFKLSAYIGNERLLKMIDEQKYANFLASLDKQHLRTFYLDNIQDFTNKKLPHLAMRAIVRDILKRHEYEAMDGLRLLKPTNGVITWTVLSSPSVPYRLTVGFSHDAFVVIDQFNSIEKSSISIFNRDTRDMNNTKFSSKKFSFFWSI